MKYDTRLRPLRHPRVLIGLLRPRSPSLGAWLARGLRLLRRRSRLRTTWPTARRPPHRSRPPCRAARRLFRAQAHPAPGLPSSRRKSTGPRRPPRRPHPAPRSPGPPARRLRRLPPRSTPPETHRRRSSPIATNRRKEQAPCPRRSGARGRQRPDARHRAQVGGSREGPGRGAGVRDYFARTVISAAAVFAGATFSQGRR